MDEEQARQEYEKVYWLLDNPDAARFYMQHEGFTAFELILELI